MINLLAKEWRQLLPIAWLWLAVLAISYLTEFATERIDEQTFAGWCEGYCDYNGHIVAGVFGALIALVTAYSLFPREHDDATIDFLRALPVSRRSIFFAKFFAAWLLLCSIQILAYLLDALILQTNPESIGGMFYTQVWFTLLWRDCVFSFVILSHGVLLSWFRTAGLIVYTAYMLLLMWLESRFGNSGVWSIFSMLGNEYEGSDLLVNWQSIALHTGVATVCLMTACYLWSRTESSATGTQASSGKGLRVIQASLTLLAFLGITAALFYQVSEKTGSGLSDDIRVVSTEHYRFVYPAAREDTMQYILQHAESDYATLAEMLGVSELPKIRVDMTAQSEHAAGLATWKKIQMDLDAFSDDVSQRRVLSHETTHVLQAVESNRSLAGYYSAVNYFVEGMAQYTSFQIVPEQQRRDSNWSLAGVSWKRQSIEFTDMLDAQDFAQRFDAELHYSLGDLWTRSFVEVCGTSAMGEFLRAAGRDGVVRNLPPMVFWRDTMREIDCDLDTVNEHWTDQMDVLYQSVDRSAFPEFTDITVRRDQATGRILISAYLRASEDHKDESDKVRIPSRFIVRVERSSTQLSAGVNPTYRGELVDDVNGPRIQFSVPDFAVDGKKFRYQLGFTPEEQSRYYYERWRSGSL